jgi:hypothetical protein
MWTLVILSAQQHNPFCHGTLAATVILREGNYCVCVTQANSKMTHPNPSQLQLSSSEW